MPSEMKSLAKWIFTCLIRVAKATTHSETLLDGQQQIPRKEKEPHV